MRLNLGANSGGLNTSGFVNIGVPFPLLFLVVVVAAVEVFFLSWLKKRKSGSTRMRTGSLKGPTPCKTSISAQI